MYIYEDLGAKPLRRTVLTKFDACYDFIHLEIEEKENKKAKISADLYACYQFVTNIAKHNGNP